MLWLSETFHKGFPSLLWTIPFHGMTHCCLHLILFQILDSILHSLSNFPQNYDGEENIGYDGQGAHSWEVEDISGLFHGTWVFVLPGPGCQSRWARSLWVAWPLFSPHTATRLSNESGRSYKPTSQEVHRRRHFYPHVRGDTLNLSLKQVDNTHNTTKLEWSVICLTWVTLR